MFEIGVTFLNPDSYNVKLENWYLCHVDFVDDIANRIVIALDVYDDGEIHIMTLTRVGGDDVISGKYYKYNNIYGGNIYYDVVFAYDISPSLFEIYREVGVRNILRPFRINYVDATVELVLLNRMNVVMGIGTTVCGNHYMVHIDDHDILRFSRGNWLKWSAFISKNEERWNRLYHGLIHKLRIEHKMRPDGPFVTKLIERDQDFQNGENTKN